MKLELEYRASESQMDVSCGQFVCYLSGFSLSSLLRGNAAEVGRLLDGIREVIVMLADEQTK